MSTTVDLVQALKNELKTARMTYADLARALGMAESSVKRMLAKGDMPLSRVDAICRALKIDFAELARRVADAQPLLKELSQEQEKAVVKDKKLLLVAISVLSQWTLEQIVGAYRISEAECIGFLAQLDRIGIIELRPMNRYRLKLAKTFRWRPHGPVMEFFRDHVVLDYYRGGFDGPAEGLLLVHGTISKALAPAFLERLQRVAADFAQQHQTDQRLPPEHLEGYTLLLGMRNWEFEAFTQLRRGEITARGSRTPVRPR
ncbi:MAG: transcriptional regulator [Variovorax paradoxus]|uniref:Transcriptional regulator n=1 Tax=Variovorax paradoxus TaxID=34073 RepID=A0A2W5PPH4_VARPD|nr:MAG: transcriptional regulator [Variovorax paradoxus]